MRLIISPAKKMVEDPDALEYRELPEWIERAERLRQYMAGLSFGEAKELWKCNDKIAEQNYERFQKMDLRRNLTPALTAYQGIQYQYMAPAVMERKALDYLQEHLRILSGFYGILKPMDGVVPYRLEMQAKVKIGEVKSLYEFWGTCLADSLFRETNVIVNLASREYSRCIQTWLKPDIQWIDCIFGEKIGDKIIEKGTFAKMARGEMVRFMAEIQAEHPEDMKKFDRLKYHFSPEFSNSGKYVFLKE